MYQKLVPLVMTILAAVTLVAQEPGQPPPSAAKRSADFLRGSVTIERQWWDLLHYDLTVCVDPVGKILSGSNRIKFRTTAPGQVMQIDLQPPLAIDSVTHDSRPLKFDREGSVYWVRFPDPLTIGNEHEVSVTYSGSPIEAKNPPWSGGLVWRRDDRGKPFIATACQGLGASAWWPCKDHGYDEPDDGMDIRIVVPEDLKAVSNGRLIGETADSSARTRCFHWRVSQPINNYAVTMNVGDYVHLADKYQGAFGQLDVDYWVLKGQQQRAKTHFKEVPRTIEAFEHWFGKYPFYQDSYKLVVAPFLGMEHQSAVSYGNGFRSGYQGKDLSGTGIGMKFDFIIVHETGHEWFGNSISSRDIADMWIHESFTSYAETLFLDYHFTTQQANDYVIGCRALIANDRPIIGKYGVHQRGSGGDMYYKGANLVHMIRQIIDDDKKFRELLRGMNRKFFHQTVTSQQIETFISQHAGIDLSSVFDQYLRTTQVPRLSITHQSKTLNFRFENCNPELSFPVKLIVDGHPKWITPTNRRTTVTVDAAMKDVKVDPNFYLDSSVQSQ